MTPQPSISNVYYVVCNECGYDLRGHQGDVLLCPECGHKQPRTELCCPPSLVEARVRRMTRAVLAFGVSVVIAFATGGLLATPAVIFWFICRNWFSQACYQAPGWQRIYFVASGNYGAIALAICLATLSSFYVLMIPWEACLLAAFILFAMAGFLYVRRLCASPPLVALARDAEAYVQSILRFSRRVAD